MRQIAFEAVHQRIAGLEQQVGNGYVRVIRPSGEVSAPLTLTLPGFGVLTTPPDLYMTAANCLARDLYAADFAAICMRMGRKPELHRRLWEYAFAAHHLEARGLVAAGKSGLVVPAPDDPLVDLFSAQGCAIATFSPDEDVDRRHDFLWSIATVLNAGPTIAIDRVVDLVDNRLKAGGVAIFTGDFNISAYGRNNPLQPENAFTRSDVDRLSNALAERGHRTAPLPFEFGTSAVDALVDLPPFASGVHLKIGNGPAVVTCFGLIVFRGPLTGANELRAERKAEIRN